MRKCTECGNQRFTMVKDDILGDFYTKCVKCGNEERIGHDKDIEEQFEVLCVKKSLLPIKYRKISQNEADMYLKVVLVLNLITNEYIVYLYNFLDNAFYEGNYYTELPPAMERYHNKR